MKKIFNCKNKYLYLVGIIILLILIYSGYMVGKSYLEKITHILKNVNKDTGGNLPSKQFIPNCKPGHIVNITSKEGNFKANFYCAKTFRKINTYPKLYKTNNGKVLIIISNEDDIKNNFQAILLNPVNYKLINLNTSNIIEEKDFIYGQSKKIPENKIFISSAILFNCINNKFYKIPEYVAENPLIKVKNRKNLQNYNDFIRGNYVLYKEIFTPKQLQFQNGKIIYLISYKRQSGDNPKLLDFITMQDNYLLKRYKSVKLKKPVIFNNLDYKDDIILAMKSETEIFFIQNNIIQIYNPVAGKISAIAKLKEQYVSEKLYYYNNQLILVHDKDFVDIFNLKTKTFSSYSLKENRNAEIEYKTVVFLPSGYLLFYNFEEEYSLLFNIKQGKFFKVKNLSISDNKCSFSQYNDNKRNFYESSQIVYSPTGAVLFDGSNWYDYSGYNCYKYNKSVVIFNLSKIK